MSFDRFWVQERGTPPGLEDAALFADAAIAYELGSILRARTSQAEREMLARAFLEALAASDPDEASQLRDLLSDYVSCDGTINTYSATAMAVVRDRVRAALGPDYPSQAQADARAHAIMFGRGPKDDG